MSKVWALAAAFSMSACSIGITTGVQSGWTVEQKPECSSDPTGPLIDAFLGAGALTIAAELESNSPGGNAAGTALLVAIPFVISAYVGEERVRGCREARHLYQLNEVAHHVGQPKPVVVLATPPIAAPFYCYASPVDGNIGMCARTEAWCSDIRSRETTASAELGQCVPAAVSSCFHYTTAADGLSHDVCGPTLPTCNHLRARVLGLQSSVGDVGECTEAK